MNSSNNNKKGKRNPKNRKQKTRRDFSHVQKPHCVSLNNRSTQGFPDRLRMWMRTSDEVVISSVVNSALTYKLNGVGAGVGAQVSWAGAFAGNFPSGLTYLLASTVATGASAPYYFARIIESKITVLIMPDGSNNVPFDVFLWPTYNASYSGVPKTQLREQKYMTYRTCGLNTSGKPTILQSQMGVGKLLGKTEEQELTDDGFYFTYNTDPTYLAYWQLFAGAQDGVSNIKFNYVVTIDHHFEFTLNLTAKTTQPTVAIVSLQKEIAALKQLIGANTTVQTPSSLSLNSEQYVLVKKQ
jgi:hypothetical protein